MKKKDIICAIATLFIAAFIYYFTLPAINLTNPGFYVYIGFLLVIYFFLSNCTKENIVLISKNRRGISVGVDALWSLGVLTIMIVLILIVNFVCTPIFNASGYSSMISVNEDGNFNEDVNVVDFNKIPLLDKDSSVKLGDRKMGEIKELVSQFTVSDLYTQINYNDSIIRVTPIEYAGFIKWIGNHKDGIKGYISVNSVDGSAELKKLDKGIKYTPSAYFNEDLMRKLRFAYPTRIFDEATFEIDNDGNPYYVIPTIKYVGIGLRKDIKTVIILNAITGESKEYNVSEVPEWVDHVYSANLVIEQINNWGSYRDGFINSIIGQKNVVNTTEGYNYLAMNNDIYLYTGITSVSNDESNLGFVLTNLRTKETVFYNVPGAEEFSAMASAEGLVQEKNYTSSFPLLINLNGRPTYLMSLKDNAGLVKMYAFVDVSDYQKVAVSDASLGIDAAAKKYLNDFSIEDKNVSVESATIKVKDITSVIIDGNTYYYIVSTDDIKYSVGIKVNKNVLPFVKAGDTLNIKYKTDVVNQITSIE